MKANAKSSPAGGVVVRGVPLDFNCMNERHLKKWKDVGETLEQECPGALDLSTNLSEITDFNELIGRYTEGTMAMCKLFDRMFGDGTSRKLFGDAPNYALCLEVYAEFLEAVEQQGLRMGNRLGSLLTKYAPAGPKGSTT